MCIEVPTEHANETHCKSHSVHNMAKLSNPLPYDKILDVTSLKAFADDITSIFSFSHRIFHNLLL